MSNDQEKDNEKEVLNRASDDPGRSHRINNPEAAKHMQDNRMSAEREIRDKEIESYIRGLIQRESESDKRTAALEWLGQRAIVPFVT